MSELNGASLITMIVGDKELRFDLDKTADGYSSYLSGLGKGKIVQASNNYCIQSVVNEDLVSLRAIFERNKGACVQIAGELAEQVAPELEISVKKP